MTLTPPYGMSNFNSEKDKEMFLDIAKKYENKTKEFGFFINNTFKGETQHMGTMKLEFGNRMAELDYIELAVICWEKALNTFIFAGENMGAGTCCANLGTVNLFWGSIDKGIEYKERALNYYKDIENEGVRKDYQIIKKELDLLKPTFRRCP